jgi:diguanylate cyclase (GGDEF)-like protein/PAS domain S-box-containing protein
MISDHRNKIISVNKAFTDITGYSLDEVIGEDPKLLASGKHDTTFFKKMWSDIGRNGQWRGEIVNKKKNKELYTELLVINTIKDNKGKIDHFFAIFDDITETKRTEELVYRQANFDMLTHLANRHMFQRSLDNAISKHQISKSSFGLLFIDLDFFKNINDTYGHEIGDKILIESAIRIQRHMEHNDVVARIGGDEFTVIINHISSPVQIEKTVKRILSEFNEPFSYEIHSMHVTVSIGIAIYPTDGHSAVDLLKNADQAMYKVKKMGRNSFRYFTSAMQEESQRRHAMINDMHHALMSNQFEVYYQPIISLESGKIEKAEALLRWNHPEQGYLNTDEFIGFAEDSRLIIEIDEWVYQEALRQTKLWLEKYGKKIQICVNKSPIQLRMNGITESLLSQLNSIELQSDQVMVEITERVLIEQDQNIIDKLSQLHNAGIKFSLDDFGTGYSTISYLQKFKIDNIKIDKMFVANLENSTQDVTLCEAMITMAHKLGISVTAEGVETAIQKDVLSRLGCDFLQGYYFSEAVPADKFNDILKRD